MSDAESKKLQSDHKNSRVRDVMTSVGETHYEWDIASDQLNWGENAHTLLCLKPDQMIGSGREFARFLAADNQQNRHDAIASSEERDDGEGVLYRIQYALSADAIGTSSDIWIEDSGRWFAGEDGKPNFAHGIIRIINERRAVEERLARMSRFDDLTGLYNRRHLNECLQETIFDARRYTTPAAFLLIGLDRFELINSIYGYDMGDAVIAEVSRRLGKTLRGKDVIGRFSGAKIAVILNRCNETEMRHAANRFLEAIHQEVIQTEAGPVSLSASIGGLEIPRYARTAREAMAAAQQALNIARLRGLTSFASYHPDQDQSEMMKKQAMQACNVVKALNEQRLKLAYQPVVDATSHKVAFHEALVRLVDEDDQIIPAQDFIGVSEQLGLVRPIDHAALGMALDTLSRAKDAVLSINVSHETASDPAWISRIARSIAEQPDIGPRLIIEFTESQTVENFDGLRRLIENLKGLGCRVALDDFGAGFTSFQQLKQLPVDIIKVDGQFACDLVNSKENQRFIRSLIEIAAVYDARIVVEWVEDEETAIMLKEWGVDLLQGYNFGAPILVNPWGLKPIDELDDDAEDEAGVIDSPSSAA